MKNSSSALILSSMIFSMSFFWFSVENLLIS